MEVVVKCEIEEPQKFKLLLNYEGNDFEADVDEETYQELINNEKKRNQFAKMIFENYLRQSAEAIESKHNYQGTEVPLVSHEDPPSKEFTRWTPSLTKLLVSCRLEREDEFNRRNAKKRQIWSEISDKIFKITGVKVSADVCDCKFRNLNVTYRANKKKQSEKSIGQESITWEYFDAFDAVMGRKVSIVPSENLIIDTLEAAPLDTDNEDEQKRILHSNIRIGNDLSQSAGNTESEHSTQAYLPTYLTSIPRDTEVPSTSQEGDVNIQEDSPKEFTRWTHMLTKLLLKFRLEREEAFNRPHCKKKELWSAISEDLFKATGIKVSSYMCDSKFRNLSATYRANKEKRNTLGKETISWEYFEDFDAVRGTKYATYPWGNIIMDTLELDQEDLCEVGDKDNVPGSSRMEKAHSPRTTKGKITKRLTLSEYLYNKNKREIEYIAWKKDFLQKMWKEKKFAREKELRTIEKFKEREINAVQELTNVINRNKNML